MCQYFIAFLCSILVLDEAINKNKPEMFIHAFKAVLKHLDNTVKCGQTDF